jgi:hypothetical protein
MSLYRLALSATCGGVLDTLANVDSIDELPLLNLLPVPLQCDIRKEIKRIWMKFSTPSENPDLYEYRDINFDSLDKLEFIMLMHHPRNMHPDFWPSYVEIAHLTTDYYEHYIGRQKAFLYCHACFMKRCIPKSTNDDDINYLEYWKSMNWRFFNVVRHDKVEPRWFVYNMLKSKNSWCDWCILTPLFKLYNFDRCAENTHYHDDDGDTTVFKITELYSPFNC